MTIIATTNRLELRKFSLSDAEGFYGLNEDPEVIKYTGDQAFRDITEARNFIEQYDHYEKWGYGRWSVYRKDDGSYLGFCGLKYSAEKEETDLGFRFFKKYWNKGYATEAAKAALKVGYEDYQLLEVVGRAMKENLASHRVLQKLGMQKTLEFRENDAWWIQYEMMSEDYENFSRRPAPE